MGEPNSIIHELLQGLELARQLQVYLHMPSSSQETRDLLIQQIISTFEKALQMANWKGPVPAAAAAAAESSQHPPGIPIRMSDSPLSTSPRSEDSDRDFKDQDQNAFKKSLPRWTKQIRVTPGMGVEGPLDDGYSWRKYGQKDILGARYPRGYYRCTHRNVQGCVATKHVQRSDEDPTIFEITYRGRHTCTMANNVGASSVPLENQEPSLNNTNPQQQQNILQSLEQHPNELLMSLRRGLKVQTENLDSPDQSFRFPSSTDIKIESQVFPSPVIENTYAEKFSSPSYMSPATSGISQFSVSPSGVNSFGGNPNLASSGSQINDMIPATTSAPNSSTVGLDFPFDQFEFDGQNFTFDNPRFFS
ncbi:probable WRKY transcription factor 53 isoform X2 [Cajanus cajan]|uniref:probable WRKY transcription factor 53 isoform X2 n=1 Tax=Cajanus cajan TaxID=3821 RepID=UPI0010FB41E7|nr:probable WRKY transcription factor 53 isoform X2 [Cajanus cajan]